VLDYPGGGRLEPELERPVVGVESGTRLSAYLDYAAEDILRMEASRPIQPTDYDTCWVARLTNPEGPLAYPDLFAQLLEQQHPDGSWGGTIPYMHDRLLTTLATIC
jgi:halimadienyl-diphosphate synthase